jgi:hypothetical protein
MRRKRTFVERWLEPTNMWWWRYATWDWQIGFLLLRAIGLWQYDQRYKRFLVTRKKEYNSW